MTEYVSNIENTQTDLAEEALTEESSVDSSVDPEEEKADEIEAIEDIEIPSSESEDPLSRYIRMVNKYPLLSSYEETDLARKWVETQDRNAADKLLTSHMRLVIKIAYSYKNYGYPMEDLIAQGSIGLFHALRNFDPEMGNRFSTYAMWWIRAEIKDYVLHNWSLVKIGTTRAQKRLFFSLRKARQKIQAEKESRSPLSDHDMKKIAKEVGVPVEAVQSMELRLGGRDSSLNTVMGDEDGNDEWQDFMPHEGPNPEEFVLEMDEFSKRKGMLEEAMQNLNPRESEILFKRRLQEVPETLESLSHTYGLSRERVRQIENAAFQKLQNTIKSFGRRMVSV